MSQCQRLPSNGLAAPVPFLDVPLNPTRGCGKRAKRRRWQIHFSTMAMRCFLTKEIPKKKTRLERMVLLWPNGKPRCVR